ncbi:TPA: lysozyme, partial [Haemophilus influenzae]
GEFPRWVYASGKKLAGLVVRREKEKALCLADLKLP